MYEPNSDETVNESDGRLPIGRRTYLKSGAAVTLPILGSGMAAADDGDGDDGSGGTSSVSPTNLRVDYESSPNNIQPDSSAPQFFWQIPRTQRNVRQAAYQIRVWKLGDKGTQKAKLVWDSGRVNSSQTVGIRYRGESLSSNQTYLWSVRIWTENGRKSGWSVPSSFATAITNEEWEATWIGKEGEGPPPLSLSDASWIWYPEGSPAQEAPAETRYFRYTFEVDNVQNAMLAVLVDNSATVYINGADVGEISGFSTPTVLDVADQLRPEANVLAIAAQNSGGPAGLLAHLRVQHENSTQTTEINTNGEWLASQTAEEGWTTAGFDASSWSTAKVLADSAIPGAWGGNEPVPVADLPSSPFLRTEATLEKPIASARAHVVTLGYGRLYINGSCYSGTMLKPWTEFDDRTLYYTYDVTEALRSGTNAFGLWLGHGWFSKEISNWSSYGAPRGLMQLHITFEDGETRTLTTDPSWQTAPSPVLENDIYDGETYDARKERSGWSTPSYDASDWEQADELASPANALSQQEDEDWEETFELEPRRLQPREVVKTLEPESITEHEDGYIVDFGQNHSGWVELTMRNASAGEEITIKHAEILDNRGERLADGDDEVVVEDWQMLPDDPTGDIYTGNLRAAEQTDVYIAKGAETETYAPLFTYHGFRYAKVIGYPGELTEDDIRSKVVHTGFDRASTFEISDEDLQQVQDNAVWGQRSVSQSLPLDNPQRNERMGWTGDAHMSARSQLFNFDAYRFFEKYMEDHDDNQSPEGSQTDTIPHAYGGRPADPNWAKTRVTIPWFMYLHSGDTRVLSERYEGMKRYVEFWNEAAENHIVPAEYNHYGDWLAPRPPEIENDLALLNTFAHYQTTDILAQIADTLGNQEDAQQYRDRAAAIADAFNESFFRPDTNSYGSGDMTTYALPLYAGIVPDGHEDEVAEGLVATIWEEYDGTIGTGFVGTRPLLFTLVEHGYINTAYHLVSQPEEPGWVFMVRNGATTQWERWDAPDYGPSLNSLNHRNWTLISEWFYRVLAGINAEEPGFSRVSFTPYVVDDLDHAGATVETVRGEVSSRWERTEEGGLRLNVATPGNVSGTVSIPTLDFAQERLQLRANETVVLQGGNLTGESVSGIGNVSVGEDRITAEFGSGTYNFYLQEEAPSED